MMTCHHHTTKLYKDFDFLEEQEKKKEKDWISEGRDVTLFSPANESPRWDKKMKSTHGACR